MLDALSRVEGMQDVLEGAGTGVFVGNVYGAALGGLAVLLQRSTGRDVVVVCRDRLRQQELLDDVALFGGSGVLFPQRLGGVPQRTAAVIERDRLAVLGRLGTGIVVVATVESLKSDLPRRGSFEVLRIEVGKKIDTAALLRRLEEAGYEASDPVELPGQFVMRGGIVDVFARDAAAPIRIELFGDTVESLRIFDAETQESKSHIAAADVLLLQKNAPHDASLLDHVRSGTLFVIDGESVWEALGGRLRRRGFGFVVAHPTYVGGSPNLAIQPARRLGDVAEAMRYLATLIPKSERVFLVISNEGEKQRLYELMEEYGVDRQGVEVLVGFGSGGFVSRNPPFALLLYEQMLGRRLLRHIATAPAEQHALTKEVEFQVGDYCVHEDYGICRFVGVRKEKIDGRVEEVFVFRFGDGATISVRPTHISKVRRYIGSGRGKVRLSRLDEVGSWRRRKRRVMAAVGELAREMLRIQAIRLSRPGIRYPPDTTWQHEFEAAFPFVETPDQLKVVQDVKADMTSSRPMDRLIAGDVGYGKTEVAMRAAFKAVQFGKQVAVLVPTTLLAEQHYRVFRERMAEFPVVIECLSRFRSRAQQRDILKRLAEGGIDIIIGTHRLLSRDVRFRDLGLVIIDEEQRFGVAHKEHFKRLRACVDVLTLTATPIPRTLHLALSGLRDISVLATPPPTLHAVVTRVCLYDERLIRQAIMRELQRGGQVFFVHNRVKTIGRVYAELTQLVPEARIAVAHGQLDEAELASVMADFLDRKVDVLLTTTIIESGLDIPNVNTLIVDNAHKFGLADLHQLRGRVGRHGVQGFAYFLVRAGERLTDAAKRRLAAIAEHDQLGAGFRLALRDLEIRGAGELLGKKQSGHIHAVGYHLYVKMLADTIARLRRQKTAPDIIVDVDIPAAAFLPEEYIPDLRQRIEAYRALSEAHSADDVRRIAATIRDRYGPPPPQAQNLILKSEIAAILRHHHITYVGLQPQGILFETNPPTKPEQFAKLLGHPAYAATHNRVYLPLPDTIRREQPATVLKFLLETLHRRLADLPSHSG